MKAAIAHYAQDHAAWKSGARVEHKKRKTQNEIGLAWTPSELPFGGLKRDFKRRAATYASDWKDGFTPQSVAVVLFMFFACVAPGIAFGSLLDRATGGSADNCKRAVGCTDPSLSVCPCTGAIGVIEMLLSTGVCGIAYALIGGSPLTILGGTGPILVFTGILSNFADSLEVEFLPLYAWTGLWIGVLSVVLASSDAGPAPENPLCHLLLSSHLVPATPGKLVLCPLCLSMRH